MKLTIAAVAGRIGRLILEHAGGGSTGLQDGPTVWAGYPSFGDGLA